MIQHLLLSFGIAACVGTAVYLTGRLVWWLLVDADRKPRPPRTAERLRKFYEANEN